MTFGMHLLHRQPFGKDENWTAEDLQRDIQSFKDLGMRTMAPTKANPVTATVQNHRDVFAAGFDVVYTYNLANAVIVRQEVNTARGISPA